jgi:hypothetical protein
MREIKRVVTGHDSSGRAQVAIEGAPSTIVDLAHIPGLRFHEIWQTRQMPAPIDNEADPTLGPLRLPPPANGTLIRIVDIPPDTPEFLAHGGSQIEASFAEIGAAAEASTAHAGAAHPLMHRTVSVDFGIIIEGELTLILDQGESLLLPGDVVVQRGTNHAWANRSGRMCRIAFVLVDGRYAAGVQPSVT